MKKVFVLIAFLSFLSAQAIYYPKENTLFLANFDTLHQDTILSAGNITSRVANISYWRGAALVAFQAVDTDSGGMTAKNIDIYAKVRVRTENVTYGWGCPYDSLAADSLYIGQWDSASVKDNVPFYIDLANEPWWSWYDEIYFILDPAANADSILMNGVIKGQ